MRIEEKYKGIENKSYYRYAMDVAEGRQTACRYVVQACHRFLKDLEREDIEFRQDVVQRAEDFIFIFYHFKGKTSGSHFRLEPFQSFIVCNLVGWYHTGTDERRYTSGYIEMARKGGKTALIAAIAMYYFLADKEDGAEVDLAANSKEQAKIAFEFCSEYSRQIDPQGIDLKVYRDTVTFAATSSKIKVFASDDSKLDGFNASVGIIDEFHSAKNTKVRDVIKSSMGMRKNPMLLTITSAGFDKTLPCYRLRTTCTEILQGLKEDDSMFCMIFTLDEGDDWRDPSVWIKSNPNLGKTVTEKYLAEQVKGAINNPTEEMSVRTKNLGEWLSSSELWISERYILDCSEKLNIEDFAGCECWVGVDLASVSDMTALSYMLRRPGDEKYYFKTEYFLPETALEESSNRDLYRIWKRMGLLNITPGNVTDYQYITNHVMETWGKVAIQNIFYDQWNAISWATQCTELGLPMESYSQNIGSFNRPTREFERLCRSRMLVIDDNEITRWMFSNVSLKTDHNGNAKPNKGAGAEKKIDGVIAMLEALGGYLTTPGLDARVIAV